MNNTFSKKINLDEEQLILRYMSSHIKENNNQSIKYFFKTKNYTMSIYKNGTLLIQGSNYNNILKMLNIVNESTIEKKESNIYIGSDESGNGDFFGGVAVCACKINKEKIDLLKSIGVRDSKLLNDNQIIEIARELKKHVEYEIKYLNPYEYNELYFKYNNINTIKTIMHSEVLNKISNNQKCVIDKYTSDESFRKQLKEIKINVNFHYILETKAESKYMCVAAASILARERFIKEINIISKNIGIKIPLGSVDSNILPTLSKIKNKIDLKRICKIHFKTISKI